MSNYVKYERYLRDKQAEEYENKLSGYHTSIEFFLLKYLLPKQTLNILDAGCGTGRLSQILIPSTKNNSLFCGIDLSFRSLCVARNKFNNILVNRNKTLFYTFVQGSVSELPFRSDLFDLIICSEVFEHILNKTEQINMLSEFRRCLKSKGTLILSTYNYCIFDKIRNVPKIYNKSDGRKPNYVRLTKKELYDIVSSVFKEEEIISMHGGLCLWGLPYKIREKVWFLSNNFVKKLEIFFYKTILGFIFGHLHFVKIVKKGK